MSQNDIVKILNLLFIAHFISPEIQDFRVKLNKAIRGSQPADTYITIELFAIVSCIPTICKSLAIRNIVECYVV